MHAAGPAQPAAPPGVDYSRKWFVMVAIAMGVFLGTIDGSIVNVALPTLVRDLDTTFPVVQWVVLGYLLAVSTLTMMVGRLGDMIGKKPIYTGGFGMFTLASMLCGIAPSVGWLIGFRIFQAIGASMIVALGLAILTEAFPPTERGRALGITGTMVSIGIAIGPSLGGFLIDALSWHWIFFVNLPVGIVGTLAAIRFVPDVPPPGGQRFDVPGAVSLFATLLTLLLALTLGQEAGFSSVPILALFAASALSLATFLTVERRVAQPIVELGLFRNGLLSVNLVTGFATFVSIAGLLILLPFYLEGVLGFDPGQTGLLLIAAPVALGIVAPISGSLSDRFGTRPVTVAGLAIMTLAYLGVSTLGTDTGVLDYVLVAVPVGIGIGVFQSPNNSAIMGAVPHARLGIASGMLSLTRITGQITGIALLGAVWASRVAAATGAGVTPTEAPAAAQVRGLRETMIVVTVLMAASLALAVWSLITERRQRRALLTDPAGI
jgi:EmrB/QacA subfamily drug resistance transporter